MSFPLSLPTLQHTIHRIVEAAIVALGTDGMRRGSSQTLLALAQDRMRRIRSQLTSLILRAIAGTLRPPRARRPAPDPAKLPVDRPEGFTPKLPGQNWPRSFGWAAHLAGGGNCLAVTHVGGLLDSDEEMRRLLAVAPQLVRLIRPLFWMMGQTLPDSLRLPHVKIPAPEGYVDQTRNGRGEARVFTRHAMLVMTGWRAPAPQPRRKPSPALLARRAAKRTERQELRRIKAKLLADDAAKLKTGGAYRRPPPQSKILNI